MNVLVAGATGFVGSHLVPELLARQHRVRCLTRDPVRSRDRLPEQAEVVRGDVHDPGSLAEAQAVLVQTARFSPRGIAGRLYWIALYPLHLIIFSGMASRIVKRADSLSQLGAR